MPPSPAAVPADDPEVAAAHRPARRTLEAAAVAVLLAAHAWLAVDSLRQKSVTYDEVSHLPAGLAAVESGELRLNRQHPPLVKLLAGTAAATSQPRLPLDAPAYRAGDEWEFGKAVLFTSGNDDAELLLRGRLPMVLISLLGALATWLWATRLGGRLAGLAALGLYAFSPTILAHARLVTMDVPVAAFSTLTLYAWWRSCTNFHRGAWPWLAGLGLGLALATKFSGLVLLPAIAACQLLTLRRPSNLCAVARAWSIVAVVAVVCVEAAYLFTLRPGAYFSDLGRLYGDLPADHAYYLAGEFRPARFPHYFLLALGLKSTPIELAAMIGGLVAVALDRSRWRDALFLWLPAAVWLVATSALASNQGVRYVIPVLPLAFILGARVIGRAAAANRKAAVALTVVLVALQAREALAHHPDYLPYFNAFAGGVRAGPRWLDDSNVDWSEDLRRLPAWLSQRGVGPVRLAFFGPNSPQHYGIARVPFLRSDWCETPRPGAYVVSAHVLARGMRREPDGVCRSDWLVRYRPADVLGGSLYLFLFESEASGGGAPSAPGVQR